MDFRDSSPGASHRAVLADVLRTFYNIISRRTIQFAGILLNVRKIPGIDSYRSAGTPSRAGNHTFLAPLHLREPLICRGQSTETFHHVRTRERPNCGIACGISVNHRRDETSGGGILGRWREILALAGHSWGLGGSANRCHRVEPWGSDDAYLPVEGDDVVPSAGPSSLATSSRQAGSDP